MQCEKYKYAVLLQYGDGIIVNAVMCGQRLVLVLGTDAAASAVCTGTVLVVEFIAVNCRYCTVFRLSVLLSAPVRHYYF